MSTTVRRPFGQRCPNTEVVTPVKQKLSAAVPGSMHTPGSSSRKVGPAADPAVTQLVDKFMVLALDEGLDSAEKEQRVRALVDNPHAFDEDNKSWWQTITDVLFFWRSSNDDDDNDAESVTDAFGSAHF